MRARYLLCYDVRDERRLRAVHKLADAYGEVLHYSLFVCDLSVAEAITLMASMGRVVNQSVDSVVLIKLASGVQDNLLGRSRWLGPRPVALEPASRPQVV
ncbi:MAG: CRISPR-associated endonuclease Cas2 [Acidimicrobiales bacterium]